MWIKSQNKMALVEVKEIYVMPSDSTNKNYEVCYYSTDRTPDQLGTYSTKEKALKVMNMIQKFKDEEPKFIEGEAIGVNAILAYINYNYRRTFQMPLDSEV